MRIVKELKGPDYKAYLIEDVIRDFDNVDAHSWFDGEFKNFEFKNDHKEFELHQYETPYFHPVQNIVTQISEDLKGLFGEDFFPEDVYPSVGVQELHHSSQDKGYTAAIPPHVDSSHYCALTIFVNKNWNVEWGGWNYILSGVENEIIQVTPPKGNLGVLIFSPSIHGACPVFTNKRRRTLQIFYTYDNKKSSYD